MKQAVCAGLMFTAVVLQTTLMQSLDLFGVKADLICALLVAAAMQAGPYAGATMGGIGGLVLDVLFMRPGFYAVQYLLIGMLGGLLPGKIRFVRVFLPAVLCFALFVGKELLQLVYLFLTRVDINFSVAFTKMMLGGVYTAALMVPLYFLVRALWSLSFMRVPLKGEEKRL